VIFWLRAYDVGELGKTMGFQPGEKLNLSRSLITLLIVVFLAWTAGAHAVPFYEDPSASSEILGDYGITDSSSDGSSSAEAAPLRRYIDETSQSELTSSALVHLAFAGPRLRLLSYPGLAQAPPLSR
jgi:hypothetical protein